MESITNKTMRPIKFRAWNKQNGMMEVVALDFKSAPDVTCRWGYESGGFYSEGHFTNSEQAAKDGGKKACIVMQFTGLLDKNGKEIYEGDIVQQELKDKIIGIGKVYWHDNNARFIISSFSSRMNEWQFPLSQYAGTFEVLGNIYENSELLK